MMRVLYKHFRGAFRTWRTLFQQAADFASEVGRHRLISISHSEEGVEGVVTVWYWGTP